MPDRYVVLGDVVQSREIEDRTQFRTTLSEACDSVNDRFDDVNAPFQLLKGVDELGAVLASVANIYEVVKTLFDALYPHRLRVAVVLGEIDVGEETGVVSEMDGPAFHRTDSLLDQLEASELLFEMQTGRDRFDLAVSDEINLLLARRQQWTDRQHEIISSYEQYENQYEVADQLGITQQAVSATLQQASWSMLRQVEERLHRVLEEYE